MSDYVVIRSLTGGRSIPAKLLGFINKANDVYQSNGTYRTHAVVSIGEDFLREVHASDCKLISKKQYKALIDGGIRR